MSGLRVANVWKTNASVNMPTPVMAQPTRRGPGAATAAICEGSAKIPLPIIDPTTMAVRAASPRPVLATGRVAGGGEIRVSDISSFQFMADLAAQGRP
jgi:hypothetical protein